MWQFLIPAATAAMGANRANKQAEQQKAYNLAQAETTRYSPWTGMKGQLNSSYAPSAMEGGLAGGLQGLGIAQGFGAFGSKPASTGLMSGVDSDLVEQQANPWEAFSGKKYSTFQRTV